MKPRICVGCLLLLLIGSGAAMAQTTTLPQSSGSFLPGSGQVTSQIVQYVVLITALSVAPGLVVMLTSFTRIIIALSFLRSGIGLQTTPSTILLVTLAMFLTFFIMAPTFDLAWKNGVRPYLDGKIAEQDAYERSVAPFRDFMLNNVREKEVAFFQDMASKETFGAEPAASDLRILVPAFMVSELRRGFEIGFLIVLPFLIIDLVVATVTMSMGMMMLPPTVISLPFKVLFFVLIDGWTLLIGSLVKSFHGT
jgi:flagellar biosynthesis protein FliP